MNRASLKTVKHTSPSIMRWDESLGIGSDTGTPVDDSDYQTPFNFTGKLDKITLTIDRPKLTPEDIKRLRGTAKAAADGPSNEAAPQAAEMAPSGDTPTTLLEKVELRIDKREGCRKQAEAQKLGLIDRMRFIEQCMR